MKRERAIRFRWLAVLVVLPNAAIVCSPRSVNIGPFVDVDPSTVDPLDPTEQPTGLYRSINGSGNHVTYFWLGAADTPLTRLAYADYEDGIGSMAGALRPSAREVSNAVCADTLGASDFLWQ